MIFKARDHQSRASQGCYDSSKYHWSRLLWSARERIGEILPARSATAIESQGLSLPLRRALVLGLSALARFIEKPSMPRRRPSIRSRAPWLASPGTSNCQICRFHPGCSSLQFGVAELLRCLTFNRMVMVSCGYGVVFFCYMYLYEGFMWYFSADR